MSEVEEMYLGDKNEEERIRERARAIVAMTDQLGAKFESLGVKRKAVLMAAPNLGDAYAYADDVRKYIELLLETPSSDWNKLGEIFVELWVILGELKDDISRSRKPLWYLAELCDKHLPPDDEPDI